MRKDGFGSSLPLLAESTSGPLTHPEELRRLFEEIDSNKNGCLDKSELQGALERLGLPSTELYVETLLRQYDGDQDGCVTYQDFASYVQKNEARIWQAFRRFDADGSGRISQKEVTQALRCLGVPVRDEDGARMVALLDRDASDDIDFDEFRTFVCLLPQSQILSPTRIIRNWIDCADWVSATEYRLCMVPPSDPLARFLAGGLAGAVSRTVTAPLERMRTMMMADAANAHLLPTLRKMWASGGLLGLWRGNLASVAKVMPQSAIQFAVYDTVSKDLMLPLARASASNGEVSLSNWHRVAAGCLSGAAAALAVYPLETLRTNMTMGNRAMGLGYLGLAREIVRKQGWGGLYQGFQAGLASSALGCGLGFTTYEALTVAYRNSLQRAPTPPERGTLAGCAAFCTISACMPLEVIMRRLQVQGSPGYPVLYSGPLDCVRKIAATEGLRGFYRGAISSYMKVVPSIASVRFLYEVLIQAWATGGIRRYRTQEQG